jgi:hypothetical protein
MGSSFVFNSVSGSFGIYNFQRSGLPPPVSAGTVADIIMVDCKSAALVSKTA